MLNTVIVSCLIVVLAFLAGTLGSGSDLKRAWAASNNNFCMSGICFPTNPAPEVITNKPPASPSVQSSISSRGNATPYQHLVKLEPWGSENGLNIQVLQNSSIPIFRITGSSGVASVGFVSQHLNYSGKSISLTTGKIDKGAKDFQISFSFVFRATTGAEYNLIFVNGPLNILGWRGNNYYEKIGPHSLRLIDVDHMLTSHNIKENVLLDRIHFVMQKESTLRNLDFGIS